MHMSLTRKGYLVTALIMVLYAAVTTSVLLSPSRSVLFTAIRLAALLGLLSLSIAVIMTPFLPDIYRLFGRPFLKVHHLFAAAGLFFATLHPVLFAIALIDITVFIPLFGSLYDFLATGGRVALIALWIAFFAVLFRAAMPKYWRPVHALMYIVILLAVIHGDLIGTDFTNPFILLLFNCLALLAVGVFVVKRVQQSKR
jgi:sulfoxide reductase heme-binding subunit YedZ